MSYKSKSKHAVEDAHDRMLPFRFDLPDASLGFIDSLDTLPRLERALEDCVALGIDTETQPAFKKRRQDHFLTHPTAIVQIALRSSRGAEEVLIVDMLPCLRDQAFKERLDDLLCKVLQDRNIIKVGQGLANDFDELHMSYPSMRAFQQVHGIVETFALVKILQPDVLQLLSLKALVKQYLHYDLLKTQQCSNWGKRPLSAAQIQYAACDALVLLRLYDAMLCEIEELYAERDEDFAVQSVAISADLTVPRAVTKSAKKRKSDFFHTRETLRKHSINNNKDSNNDSQEIEDSSSSSTTLADTSSHENASFSLSLFDDCETPAEQKLKTSLLRAMKKPTHTRFVVVVED